ncbi:hypothetical protein [Bacillus sp. P14.5]|uniref:hypothetical protein n=1 Tax=Bacillus sp. P14.5 TaxID=1983400 RepID=UPI000DE8305E|nr:hypothetical protein [Bacillus sp. P14.5]
MEEKIMNLLTEMNQEMKGFKKEFISFKGEMISFKKEVDQRFDGVDRRLDSVDRHLEKMDAKLDGIGYQFEQTNALRSEDVDFVTAKVNKLEKEVFILKSKNKA